jgi:hypothetical protein
LLLRALILYKVKQNPEKKKDSRQAWLVFNPKLEHQRLLAFFFLDSFFPLIDNFGPSYRLCGCSNRGESEITESGGLVFDLLFSSFRTSRRGTQPSTDDHRGNYIQKRARFCAFEGITSILPVA